jgi:hypothetical protein
MLVSAEQRRQPHPHFHSRSPGCAATARGGDPIAGSSRTIRGSIAGQNITGGIGGIVRVHTIIGGAGRAGEQIGDDLLAGAMLPAAIQQAKIDIRPQRPDPARATPTR